jgi:small subunit ribosomal protein S18
VAFVTFVFDFRVGIRGIAPLLTSRHFWLILTTMYERERENRERRPRRRSEMLPMRRKVCYFCTNKIEHISYRDANLRNFVSDKGRIVPSKISGVCHRHQRRLSKAIKGARTLSLLPYVAR